MKNLLEFITEKKEKVEDFEDKFKNVDCSCWDDLSDEEKEYCKDKKIVDFINKSYMANS